MRKEKEADRLRKVTEKERKRERKEYRETYRERE